jgi:hypothetical protein
MENQQLWTICNGMFNLVLTGLSNAKNGYPERLNRQSVFTFLLLIPGTKAYPTNLPNKLFQ